MKRAALYLRSSKDRSDVSIDAQRRELEALARDRGLAIAEEFADVVVSGKDENRPAFQALLRALKSPAREWSAILMLDTSRLARSQYVAHVFRHEAKKRGVEVVFAKTPELDGVAGIILPAVLHAMDEVHSFLSREKGVAGMAENVRRGWRAGGRAPLGYRLERVATGAVREGEPVTKSRLVPGPDFEKVAAYLRGRAQGRGSGVLCRDLGLEASAPTLSGIERNALTYAGHTVWNSKRGTVPREEWVVQRDTHQAAISEAEAEAILARLGARRATRVRGSDYLLSGLLRSPDGAAWHGNGGAFYRLGAKNVSAALLERAVLARVAADLRSLKFSAALVREARRARPQAAAGAALAQIEADLRREEGIVRGLAEALTETTARRPILARIEEAERRVEALRAEAERIRAAGEADARLQEVGPTEVAALLRALADDLEGLDRAHVKDFLRQLLDRVELDPAAAVCTIHYRIAAGGSGVKVASPRVGVVIPTFRAASVVELAFRRLRAA